MTLRFDTNASIRLCLAVLLFAAAVGSVCLAMFPAPAMADDMGLGSGPHSQQRDCCSPEPLPQAGCCTQESAADPLDRAGNVIPSGTRFASADSCCLGFMGARTGAPPPDHRRWALPLRI